MTFFKKYSILIVLQTMTLVTNGFYIQYKRDIDESFNESLINSDSFDYLRHPNNTFPLQFKCKFNAFNTHFEYKFTRVKVDDSVVDRNDDVDVYIKENDDENPVKTDTNATNVKYEFYESNNKAVATLIENSDLPFDQQYRLIISFEDHMGEKYDIYPVLYNVPNLIKGTLKKQKIVQFAHVIRKRAKYTDVNDVVEQVIQNELKQSETRVKRQKRIRPLDLYIEYLIVTDLSVLLKYQILLNTKSNQTCFIYIKILYSHVVRLYTPNWANGNTQLSDREVLITSTALDRFRAFMNNLNLTFAYDHAVGLFDKDLWSDNRDLKPESRASVMGLAYTGQICTPSRYSVVEEHGFDSVSIMIHEIGHSLGSSHDGDRSTLAINCNASSNYIMTPAIGAFTVNMVNQFKFSPCSIEQFQLNLFERNGTLKATCLANTPRSLIDESTYYSTILPGQLWNIDEQCRNIIDPNSTASVCPQTTICTQLWCNMPLEGICTAVAGWGALDGTECDTNKICQSGECVDLLPSQRYTPSLNACTTAFCRNGGTCFQREKLLFCTCPLEYTGLFCQFSIYDTTTANRPTTNKTTTSRANSTIRGNSVFTRETLLLCLLTGFHSLLILH